MPNKKTVLLLFGGESTEHEISIRSARTVFENVISAGYKVILCYITKDDGMWRVVADFESVASGETVLLIPGKSLLMSKSGNAFNFDVMFPVLHGKGGEDGSIQGLAQYLHVPIVGCGIQASALALDKNITKTLVRANVPIVPGTIIRKAWGLEPRLHRKLLLEFGGELFIKPNDQGSSVGAHRVSSFEEYMAAIKDAFTHSDTVLVEQAIDHPREIELAVLEHSGKVRISGAGEIVPDDEFYSYEAKYSADSASKILIPADINPGTLEKLRKYAETVFTSLGCKGLARVDFFLDADGTIYFNEINTMPGFTSISMYPKLWEAAGLPQKELITLLIESA